MPGRAMRNAGVSNYLAHPFLLEELPFAGLMSYMKKTEMLNTVLGVLILPNRSETKGPEVRLALQCVDEIEELTTPIIDALTVLKQSFGPIVPI
jgi:hypothetical protein